VKSVHLKVDYQPKQLDYNALYGDNKVAFFAKAVPLRGTHTHDTHDAHDRTHLKVDLCSGGDPLEAGASQGSRMGRAAG
jgi:hypothetical protein